MNNKPSQEPARTLFSYHASHGTTEGETYAYLLRNSLFDSKRGKVLANQAIVAWWLAYARQAVNHKQARATALDCIEQLEQQIAKLRRDFQIPATPQPWQGLSALSEPMRHPSDQQAHQPLAAIATGNGRHEEPALPDDSLYGLYDMEE
jgi:hypothetical protein